jgi:hypothetical protein
VQTPQEGLQQTLPAGQMVSPHLGPPPIAPPLPPPSVQSRPPPQSAVQIQPPFSLQPHVDGMQDDGPRQANAGFSPEQRPESPRPASGTLLPPLPGSPASIGTAPPVPRIIVVPPLPRIIVVPPVPRIVTEPPVPGMTVVPPLPGAAPPLPGPAPPLPDLPPDPASRGGCPASAAEPPEPGWLPIPPSSRSQPPAVTPPATTIARFAAISARFVIVSLLGA